MLVKKNQLKENKKTVRLKPPAVIESRTDTAASVRRTSQPIGTGFSSEAPLEVENKVIAAQLKEASEAKRTQLDAELTQLRTQTMSELEALKNKALQEGLQKGKEEGMSEYAEKCNEFLTTLNEAVKTRNKVIKEAESDILKLSVKIAEQIIRSEISLNHAVCLNIVAEAISKITDRDQVIVKVSNVDSEVIKRNRDRLAALLDGVKNFSIIEDSQVEPGGCIVETNLGYVDARIKTKLEAIEAALLKVHRTDAKADQ